jgi:hypothetical protein
MSARFQELLRRKAGESLENWNVPFFHVGGAGTHFPRRDEHGNPIYPPNMFPPAKAFGPLALPTAEMPRDEATIEQLLESIGFGGVWFDSHDVEGYLRTLGIYLDGHSSFVEINPSTIERTPPLLLHSSNSTTSSTSSASPVRSPEPPTQHPSLQIAEEGYFTREPPDAFVGTDSNSNNNSSLLPPYQDKALHSYDIGMGAIGSTQQQWPSLPSSPGRTPTVQEVLQRTTRPVTLDVSKMLERIVDGSACLGRAPGFRRTDIDDALVAALQEAF